MQLPALAPDHSRLEYILIGLRADVALPQRCKSWRIIYLLEQQEPTHVKSKRCLDEHKRKQRPK